MNEICGDNRFEIIAKAKAHLLDATNIDASEDEMKVLDSFLFRCWQMGWLDRYDRKTEPNLSDIPTSSEKPNNCTNCECTDDCTECKEPEHGCKDEPTISKMEQVEDELQTNGYQTFNGTSVYVSRLEDEPQMEEPSFTATDFGKGTITRYTDEPQTERRE